jgi:uncharacterized membrane protein
MTPHPQTTARIAGHPIHPMLVPLPIGCWVATLICDLVFWRTASEGWAVAAMWLLGAGLLTAVLAAAAGLTDFAGDRRIRQIPDAWQHVIGNVIAVVLALISFALRWGYGAAAAALPWGLVLSLIVGGILLFTGWKGGELVFRHGVGVVDEPAGTQAPPREAPPHEGGRISPAE